MPFALRVNFLRFPKRLQFVLVYDQTNLEHSYKKTEKLFTPNVSGIF